jgi:hypothetical protein
MSQMQACTQISDEQTGGKIIPHCNRLLTSRVPRCWRGLAMPTPAPFLRTSLARL